MSTKGRNVDIYWADVDFIDRSVERVDISADFRQIVSIGRLHRQMSDAGRIPAYPAGRPCLLGALGVLQCQSDQRTHTNNQCILIGMKQGRMIDRTLARNNAFGGDPQHEVKTRNVRLKA